MGKELKDAFTKEKLVKSKKLEEKSLAVEEEFARSVAVVIRLTTRVSNFRKCFPLIRLIYVW